MGGKPGGIESRQSEAFEGEPWVAPARTVAIALLLGFAFGFLLQKGGVAKFDILIGVLLLEDFTVVKVMLSAIVVGMVGVALLRRVGLIELQVEETVIASNVVGGLVFGVGFGLLAYCPGTDAAAVGQGNLDAVVGVAGMLLGSYGFALVSGAIEGTWVRRGKLGRKRLHELAGVGEGLATVVGFAVLVGVLIGLELWMRR